MAVLALDTATADLSVAVGEGGRLLAEVVLQLEKHHSAHVLHWIERLLAACGKGPGDIHTVVVGVGPGSYTGVRVGVTVAKTLAWARNLPVVSVSTLAGLAGYGRYFPGVVVPMIDARRQRVYAAIFAGGGGLRREGADRVWGIPDLLDVLAEDGRPVLALGDGAVRYRDLLEDRLGERLAVGRPDVVRMRAAHLLTWFWDAVLSRDSREESGEDVGKTEDVGVLEGQAVHGLVPQYLQPAEAEVKWQTRGS
ncbi:MAG: tRNA (adenosine(37)-N6)-threonylcarbamoyltransferase complex dimerization subunit type 1 TsaB [Alicyclobacillaceae bacterium]|nr:tRNA (adenosine(37)-N6)-threonylcarbamoyltransferase complex dimerization subunit type 1 TsaB [Alicyclobacillaceae bacterium]